MRSKVCVVELTSVGIPLSTQFPDPAGLSVMLSHEGALPERSLVRIWREIMGAACSQQGDFKVGVAGEGISVLALHAREHFGTAVPLVFDDLATLQARIEAAEIALILTDAEAKIPKGLHLIGRLHDWGQLLSPHQLEG